MKCDGKKNVQLPIDLKIVIAHGLIYPSAKVTHVCYPERCVLGNSGILSVLNKLMRQVQPSRIEAGKGLKQRKVCERCEWTWWCSGTCSPWWLEECAAGPRLCLMAQFTGSVAVCGLTLLQLPFTQNQSRRNPRSWTHCCCSQIYSLYPLPLHPLHPHSENK